VFPDSFENWVNFHNIIFFVIIISDDKVYRFLKAILISHNYFAFVVNHRERCDTFSEPHISTNNAVSATTVFSSQNCYNRNTEQHYLHCGVPLFWGFTLINTQGAKALRPGKVSIITPIIVVSPITIPVPWSIEKGHPISAWGWISIPVTLWEYSVISGVREVLITLQVNAQCDSRKLQESGIDCNNLD